jgi:hypothetical protein
LNKPFYILLAFLAVYGAIAFFMKALDFFVGYCSASLIVGILSPLFTHLSYVNLGIFIGHTFVFANLYNTSLIYLKV